VSAAGPVGGYTIRDLCDCRCHRVGNPEDIACGCRDCGEGLEDQ
jgi:hypothetical protein